MQPVVSPAGFVVTWDGRLDNRDDLLRELGGPLAPDSPDVSLVSEAYGRWGTHCFRKLIGDWAVSIWDPREHSLILAKDPIGTRRLHYSVEKDAVTWCTILDPLVLFAGRTFELSEEYLAGWISLFPAARLTPYRGIDAVEPSCFVRFERGRTTVRKYWDFDPARTIRYRADSEYEEHFRTVFQEAVRRRLRADAPVLAELSGGIDSSSIVCMADRLISAGTVGAPKLDTISYYDDSEPNWNERPYFTLVEEKRGVRGCHIDVSRSRCAGLFNFEKVSDHFGAAPGVRSGENEASKQLEAYASSNGNRVLLSGTGGDEIMGGVPTPIPELADLLASFRLRSLASALKRWALEKRRPWFQLLWEAVCDFLPTRFLAASKLVWGSFLDPRFLERNRSALAGYPARMKLLGPLPSFQANLAALDALRRQLTCSQMRIEPLCEKRYPYLDRDLLEFAYSVPREQLVRPGQRRSLMRRALVGIVPGEVLNRRRKASVARSPMAAIADHWPEPAAINRNAFECLSNFINVEALWESLARARQGHEVPIVPIFRTLAFSSWMQTLKNSKVVHFQSCDGSADFQIGFPNREPTTDSARKAECTTTQRRNDHEVS
jgi:asparagine synthase (glutamine-hydrolysing)